MCYNVLRNKAQQTQEKSKMANLKLKTALLFDIVQT